MVRRLNLKNKIDVYDFLERIEDIYSEFFITENQTRLFLKSNWNLITKILKYHETYAVDDKGLKGIMIIFREKNFRPYVKILTEKIDYAYDLLNFLGWNKKEELFIKIKKANPISKILQKRWKFMGDRGKEFLFVKKQNPIQEKKHEYNNIKSKESD